MMRQNSKYKRVSKYAESKKCSRMKLSMKSQNLKKMLKYLLDSQYEANGE